MNWSIHISKIMLVPRDQFNLYYGLINHLYDDNPEFLQGSIFYTDGYRNSTFFQNYPKHLHVSGLLEPIPLSKIT